MSLHTTGRPLDAHGEPTAGPALELDPESRAADLLRESPHALASAPGSRTWSVLLDDPDADRPEMVLWLGPDATVLPPHVHRTRDETFEALRGELTVTVDGDPRTLGPGESYTVDPGVPHNFANETDGVVAFRVEPPWAKTVLTQYTVSGLDHEGTFGSDDKYGEPGPLYALVSSEALSAETRLQVAPHVVQRVLWATVGRVAKLLGHRAVREEYVSDAYWRETVEQPTFS
ncbi:cupin domain-containing protein [Halobacterium jilantaiense]|uniref:Cupin domain-containing protein n=1 Tax=Halobacterium jilantaiense TaxID=355548 RepID=A0A1I0N858_9EURY|nr:cupin domain-containing protein [Halobacterium jilantaiense]SEV97015.1 Cupin domain-containing protein [Halobacterium jilantaiense]